MCTLSNTNGLLLWLFPSVLCIGNLKAIYNYLKKKEWDIFRSLVFHFFIIKIKQNATIVFIRMMLLAEHIL